MRGHGADTCWESRDMGGGGGGRREEPPPRQRRFSPHTNSKKKKNGHRHENGVTNEDSVGLVAGKTSHDISAGCNTFYERKVETAARLQDDEHHQLQSGKIRVLERKRGGN